MSAPSRSPGTEDHPHARMVLGTALASGDALARLPLPRPAGHRQAHRRAGARRRAARRGRGRPRGRAPARAAGTHPDLTWVKPTGAHVMRVGDVDEAVVAAAGRTPFESSRRVFVLERADTMNDEVANRLLKTLEEPAAFVHLILLTDALGQMLETVVSRCQLVRFDPLSPERIAAALERDGVDAARAGACGRLSLGNAARARFLASGGSGAARRRRAPRARRAGRGAARGRRRREPWRGAARPRRARAATRPQARRGRRPRASGSRTSPRAATARRSSASSRRPRSATGAARAPRCSTSASSWRRCRSATSCAWPRARPGRCSPATAPTALARCGAGPRPAPPARGRRALRGGAPVARAERERGPRAHGAHAQARAARGVSGLSAARRRSARSRRRAPRAPRTPPGQTSSRRRGTERSTRTGPPRRRGTRRRSRSACPNVWTERQSGMSSAWPAGSSRSNARPSSRVASGARLEDDGIAGELGTAAVARVGAAACRWKRGSGRISPRG